MLPAVRSCSPYSHQDVAAHAADYTADLEWEPPLTEDGRGVLGSASPGATTPARRRNSACTSSRLSPAHDTMEGNSGFVSVLAEGVGPERWQCLCGRLIGLQPPGITALQQSMCVPMKDSQGMHSTIGTPSCHPGGFAPPM